MNTEQVHLGTPLRDAAVEPREADHLAPTNADLVAAGLIDPHGPHVVNPADAHAQPFNVREDMAPHPPAGGEEECACSTCLRWRAAQCACPSCARWRASRGLRTATLGG